MLLRNQDYGVALEWHRWRGRLRKKVLYITKRNQEKMTEATGVQSFLSENDIKQYLEQVLQEI